jgi:hypothetical protein
MPEGGSFFAYSDSDQAGSFTSANNKENKMFAIRPVLGDTMTLEYNGPREGLQANLQKVIHVYRGFKVEEDEIATMAMAALDLATSTLLAPMLMTGATKSTPLQCSSTPHLVVTALDP